MNKQNNQVATQGQKQATATKGENVNKSLLSSKKLSPKAIEKLLEKRMLRHKVTKSINSQYFTPDDSVVKGRGKNQEQALKSVIDQYPKWFKNESLSQIEHNTKASIGVTAKSLTTGYGVSPDTQLDGAATRVQSLDPKIKNQTFGENDFTIYPDLLRNGVLNANSTVEQYAVFTKHGRIGHPLFQHEIGISDVSQPNLRQKEVKMKFLTATRQESFAAQIVNSIEDADRINELDALTVVGKTIEWAIFYGDSSLTAYDGHEGVEFDGLMKLTDPRNIFSAHGHSLTPELLNRAAVLIARGFGVATDAYMPVGVKADFNNQFLGAQRIMMPTRRGYTAGTDINRFLSVRGNIALHGSTVMDLDNILDDDATIQDSAPDAPQIAYAKVMKGYTADPNLNNNTFHGDFNYDRMDNKVDRNMIIGELGADPNISNNPDKTQPHKLEYKAVACSTKGDSEASDVQTMTVQVTNPTDYVDLGIKLSGRRLPDYVAIYRKGLIHGDYWLIARVPVKNMNPKDSMIHFADTNARMPETADVFVGEIRPTTIGLFQLLPMTRLNLAQVTDATSFSILWYGALAVYIPRRFAIIRNVRYNEFNNIDENHLQGLTTLGYGPYSGNEPTVTNN